MGLPFSALHKFGLPGWSTITTGQAYDRHFSKTKTGKFEDFHIAYIDFCKFFNTVMPGQDFDTPTREQMEVFFNDKWQPEKDVAKRKQKFIEYMEKNVSEATVDDSLFIMAGIAAPAAAIIAKRTGESIPQVKKFKLEYFPNVVFVPLCTLLAIMGATAFEMSKKGKAKPT